MSLLRTLNEKEEELYEVVSSKMRADQAHKLSREKTTLQTQQVKMLKDEVAKKTSVIEKLQENEKLHRESIWTNEKRIRDKDLQIENERRSREEKDKAAKDMEARCEKAKGELIKYMDEVEGKVKASTKLESEVTKLREQTSLLKKESSSGRRASGKGVTSTAQELIIKNLKSQIMCNACRVEDKSCIITKKNCFHMHCQTCIDKSFENRERKCPTCATRIDESLVHKIYLR